ncbi:hypothetical protein MMC18_000189 [Xylographa bjoerkii]|nr:hypothetical protein [Xylographa bjoerkii]
MSYFSAVFHANAQVNFVKPPLYGGLRKRKRQDSPASTDKYELVPASVETTHDSPQRLSTSRVTTIPGEIDTSTEHLQDTEERHQYSVDGIHSPWELRQELAFLNPPLEFWTDACGTSLPDGRRSGLKQRHLAVLTAVMHKSLAHGDYMRAGRAWGMLLRAEVKGHPQNIRSNGLWGLGAELLLQRGIHSEQHENSQKGHRKEPGIPNHSEATTEFNSNLVKARFSRESFEDAKAYYERLILQFPWRKWLPDSLNSLHFYPVLFGLWISFVQDQYLSALARVARDPEDPSDGDSLSEHSGNDARSTERQSIRNSAMQSSNAIAESLDELLLSFPYSDSNTLWRIRGMVAQWMGDLSVVEAGRDQQDEEEVNENGIAQLSKQENESSRRHARPVTAKDAQGNKFEEREKYLEKAKSAFKTAEKLKEQSRSRDELNCEG